MFATSAKATLTVTGIENLTVPGDPVDVEILGGVFGSDPFGFPVFPDIYTEGEGTAGATSAVSPELTLPDFDDPTILDIGDSLSIDLTTSGSAAAPGDFAGALIGALGIVTIDNLSLTDDVAVSFLLDIMLDVTASLDDPLTEDAVGGAGVDAYSFGGDLDLIEEVEADALFGIFDPPFTSSLAFTLTIGADDFYDIEIFVETGGFAEVLPAPGGMLMLLGGLVAIRWRRGRRGSV
ncbi:MAG: hypothetical protein ACPGRZ_03530 [Alphaproteobacteria bacterium]